MRLLLVVLQVVVEEGGDETSFGFLPLTVPVRSDANRALYEIGDH